MVLVLCSAWYDEATPSVFSALLGIDVTDLQGCSAHATVQVQVHPHGAVVSVEVIGFHAFDVCVVPPQSWGDQGDTKHSDASS